MVRIQRLLFALAGIAALLSLALVGYTLHETSGLEAGSNAHRSAAGHFALTDQDGHARSDADFRGRFVLLYFGYTWCPDVCPTTLQQIATALRKLGPKAAHVVPVFVTVDPDRDTPAVLKKYVSAFGPEFVGLTGTNAQITRTAHEYGVYFEKQQLPGNTYSVSHTGEIYLVGPDGYLDGLYDPDTEADALVRDLNSRF